MRNGSLTAVSRLTDALGRANTLDAVYEAALDALQQSLGVRRASILLFDANGVMSFVAWRGLSDAYRTAVNGHTPWTPDSPDREPVTIPDAFAEASLASYRPLFEAEGIRALGFFPLVHRDRIIGKFMLYHEAPHDFGEDEIALARTIAGQIGFGIARVGAELELQRERDRLSFLNEASTVLASALDYQTTLGHVAQLVVSHFADWCTIDVREVDGEFKRLFVTHRDPSQSVAVERMKRLLSRARSSAIPFVIESGEPVLVPRIDWEALRARYADDPEALETSAALGATSYMIVPLIAAGRSFGAISIISSSPERIFGNSDLELACELGRRAGYAIDNARLYRQAQDANRAKDEFLATLSHELRTPMTATLGWATMLRMQELPAETQRIAIETIERSTRAQAKLIDEILDVSRIVTGKLQLVVAPVNIRAIVEAALETIRPSIAAKGIELQVNLDDVTGQPLGDAARLQQVIWNLLSNSVKFTPSGGAIHVGLEEPDAKSVRITVRDSGCGIGRRFLPHIFERFRQADSSSSRTHGGLGLGLAIVKNIVELHGGTVHAESEGEGKGSTFTITLPVVAGVAATASPAIETSATLALSGISVLLVEDEDDTRYMLSAALQSFGARVTAVRSAAAALEAAQTATPTVLVSDIAMPDEDGYSLLLKLRSSSVERLKTVPAIALTAYARPEDREQILAAGFGFHITKPVDPISIVRAVREAAGR
jgi:signal transduction histidine kinase/ActR/RegA family two-component response regulator